IGESLILFGVLRRIACRLPGSCTPGRADAMAERATTQHAANAVGEHHAAGDPCPRRQRLTQEATAARSPRSTRPPGGGAGAVGGGCGRTGARGTARADLRHAPARARLAARAAEQAPKETARALGTPAARALLKGAHVILELEDAAVRRLQSVFLHENRLHEHVGSVRHLPQRLLDQLFGFPVLGRYTEIAH